MPTSTHHHTILAVDGTSADAADVTTPDGELDYAIGKYTITAGAPTVNDDTGDGYRAGVSWWFNTATSKFYILTDATAAAAVWAEVPLGLTTPVPVASGGTGATLAATGPGFLKQASLGSVVTVAALAAGDMPSAIDAARIGAGAVSNTEFGYLDGVTSAIQTQFTGKASTAHKDTHETGGSDAFTVADLLDAVARVIIKKSGTTTGTRRAINFIPGTNISIEIVDSSPDEAVNVTLAAAGASLGTDELVKAGIGGTADYLNASWFQQDPTNHITFNLDFALKFWAEGENYELTSITYSANNVISSGVVKWPDGSAGTFTTVTENSTWLGVDAYTITHANSLKTVTQTAVTRSATHGGVTTKPALTVA